MKIKSRIFAILIAALIGLARTSSADAEVFINDFPADITVTAGQPVDIPLFFVGGANFGKPIELFVWKEGLLSGGREYLSATGWLSFTDVTTIQPLLSLDAMIEYGHLVWRAFADTTGLESFKLLVCIDSAPDGLYTLDALECAQRIINIEAGPSCNGVKVAQTEIIDTLEAGKTKSLEIKVMDCADQPIDFNYSTTQSSWIKLSKQQGRLVVTLDATSLAAGSTPYEGKIYVSNAYAIASQTINVKLTVTPSTQNCTGLTVSPASISETLQRGNSKTVQLSVRDSCGSAISSYTASASVNWLSVAGTSVTINASSLTIGSHSGYITVNSGGTSKTVPVSLTVTAPSFSFGGGGSCTPSSISVWPINVTAESGVTKTASTSVTNNCGTAVSYSASVTSGSPWLTAASTGSGTITVTVNTAGKSAGTYSGTITISASGLSSTTLNVTLTVTGPCTPSTVEISPSSISRSVVIGSNASAETIAVRDNCGNNLGYAITSVSGLTPATGGASVNGITAPVSGSSGTGSFGVTFKTDQLPVGTYSGSIALDATLGAQHVSRTITVSIKVTDATPPPTGTEQLIQNGQKYFFGINAGETKYFYFMENSNKGTGNTNELMVDLADMVQTQMYNVDMVIRYAGKTCDASKKPTPADRDRLLSGQMRSGGPEGFYANMSGTAMETIFIRRNSAINPTDPSSGNPEGCYYVMVINVDTGTESRIRIGFSDYDSNVVW